MKRTRKIISLLLSVAMVVSLFTFAVPMTAFAVAAGDRGLNDGSTSLFTSTNTLKHTFNHAYIGGKSGDDVVGNFVSTSSTDRIYSYIEALNVSTLMSMDVMFTSESDCIEIYYTRYSNSTGSSTGGAKLLNITPTSGVTKGGYTMNTLAAGVPTSLSLNEWHNIAVDVPNSGTNSVSIYVDGKKYLCYMDGKAYGSYRFYACFKSGNVYVDNFCKAAGEPGQSLYNVADYKIEEPAVSANDKITYASDSKTFTCQNGTTVEALKQAITTDCDITVFADNTYKTVLENTDKITAQSALVLSKNNKAFRYYSFALKAAEMPENTIMYNGSYDMGIKSSGLTHTYGHDFIAGKSGDDVAGYLNATVQSTGADRRINGIAGLGVRAVMSFDVMFPSEDAVLDIYYMRYSNEDGSANTGARLVTITPTGGIAKGGYTMNTATPGPTSLSLNEWHNIAIEVPNQGTNSVYIYADGKTYTCYMDGKGYGAYRFYALVNKGEYYIDNFFSTTGELGQELYNVADYQIGEPAVSGDVTYDSEGKVFACVQCMTASELKQAIEADCDITVFTDNTYKAVLADGEEISAGNMVVLSKNDKAFRYYNIAISANEDEDESVYTYVINDDNLSCTVTGFKEGKIPAAKSDLIIPSVIDGYTVTGIGANAFRVGTGYANTYLGTVTLPDTLQTIGANAFREASCNITAWPENLKTIGSQAFYWGGSMNGELPKGLEKIGDYAFYGCGTMNKLIIPDSVNSIGDSIIINTTKKTYLSELRLPRNTTITQATDIFKVRSETDETYFFGDMKIYIPDTIKTVPDSFLKNFKTGANITIYGVYATAAWDYYEKVKDLLAKGEYKNGADGAIASIKFVDYDFVTDTEGVSDNTIFTYTVNEDGQSCTITGYKEGQVPAAKSDLIIPAAIARYKVTAIGANAFRVDTNYSGKYLGKVTLPATLQTIGANAFYATSCLIAEWPENLKSIGRNAFYFCGNINGELPEGLETIGEQAFYGCQGIEKLIIPDSVTTIGSNIIFYGTNTTVKISEVRLPRNTVITEAPDIFKARLATTEETYLFGDMNIYIPETITTIPDSFLTNFKTGAKVKIYGKYNTAAYAYYQKIKGLLAKGEYKNGVGGAIASISFENVGDFLIEGAIYGDGIKKLKGTAKDVEAGYEKFVFEGSIKNTGLSDTPIYLIIALYNNYGEMLLKDIEGVTVKAGETLSFDETLDVSVSAANISDDYVVKAFVWRQSNNEPLTDAFEVILDADRKEISVLAIANSFTNDSFMYLDEIGEADGIVINAYNMYKGGAVLWNHYDNIKNDKAEYGPNGSTDLIPMSVGIASDTWDFVALQAGTHGSSNDTTFMNYKTNTSADTVYEYIADYVEKNAPGAIRIMHMSWGPCEEMSAKAFEGKYAGEQSPRAALYDDIKAAYQYASTKFSSEDGLMIPTIYAIEYALEELGYAEHSGNATTTSSGLVSYNNPTGISLFRDETCHLTSGDHPYGRVLAGLTWYEYLTGNDARENKFQHTGIESGVMEKLKEAAHYANTLVKPVKAPDAYIGN